MPEMSFPSPTLLAIPAFVALVALEWWAVATRRANGRYTPIDSITSMTMGIGNVVSGLLLGFISWAVLDLAWAFRVIELPNTWWSVVAAFIAYDFVYYWKHRLMHRTRWFWANHVVHHSSTHYNLTTALRQPWTGEFTGLVILGAPMCILGWHPAVIVFVGGLNLLYQFWIHSEAIDRFPRWFEFIFNTPSHHRVHHARNPRYLDANYAGTLIIWDRMFATFVPELDTDRPDFGLVKNLDSYNPLWVSFHEYVALGRDFARDGLRPQRWLARLARPPGWSPDGRHNDSRAIRAAWLAENPEDAGTPGFPLADTHKKRTLAHGRS